MSNSTARRHAIHIGDVIDALDQPHAQAIQDDATRDPIEGYRIFQDVFLHVCRVSDGTFDNAHWSTGPPTHLPGVSQRGHNALPPLPSPGNAC